MVSCDKSREMLIEHCRRYPKLELRDLFKFIHQSSLGCEHLVGSYQAASDYIECECERADDDNAPFVEPLDGEYSRVHLSVLRDGLSAQTLAKLFCLSAKPTSDGIWLIEEKLSALGELITEGELSFSADEYKAEVEKWRSLGFPAVHHSDSFREKYHPAYRVIDNRFVRFLPLFSRIDSMLKLGELTLAIEGGSASGKSTLADILRDLYACTIFHIDDFFLRQEQRVPERYAEVGGNFDRERFLEEILVPHAAGELVRYRKFDCSTLQLSEPLVAEKTRLTVIEGAYSMHPELASYYGLSVFLNVDAQLQKARIAKRNPPWLAKRFYNEWIPLEREFFEKTDVMRRCDMVIDIK